MSTSRYSGCTIENTTAEALSEFRKSLEEARTEALEDINSLGSLLDEFSSPEQAASIIIGSSSEHNEIKWTAVEEGEDGNLITIFYDYLGPIFDGTVFQPRPPSSYVDPDNPTHVHCILAVDSSANIDSSYPIALCLPDWLVDLDVQALVKGTIVAAGVGLPEPTIGTLLTDGKGSPLPDSETEANNIAQVFGEKSYQNLLRSYDIPVIEDTASARAYLESVGDEYIVVGGRLLIVEGTNLIGLKQLYQAVGEDYTQLVKITNEMAAEIRKVHFVITQNVEVPVVNLICGEPKTVITIKEVFVDYNENLDRVADQKDVTVQSFNNYIFWSESIAPSTENYQRLRQWGIPEDYFEAIFSGVDAEQEPTELIQAPRVFTIEDPALLTKLQLTQSQIEELLKKEDVDGVRIPSETSVEDLSKTLNLMLGKRKAVLANGLSNKVKASIAASQAVDLSDTFQDDNRSKELATRGKACARQESLWPEIPGIPTPDIPFPDLPDPAKKIESLFGAISSAVTSATKVFDSIFNAAKKVIDPFVNKVQNLNSLAENMLENDMGECALGPGQKTSGFPQLGGGGPNPLGSGGLGAGPTPSIGGIPVPLDLFTKFMTEMSTKLNETVTAAFEKVMKAISKPICMAQKLLSTITGKTTEGETNPCKEGSDPDDTCPVEETQDIINESEELTATMEKLPQMEGVNVQSEVDQKIEEVEQFTGRLKEGFATVSQDVTRGIKKVVDELWQSMESKLELLDKFDAAIKEMNSDLKTTALTGNANQQTQTGCTPPSVGFFSDQITSLL